MVDKSTFGALLSIWNSRTLYAKLSKKNKCVFLEIN